MEHRLPAAWFLLFSLSVRWLSVTVHLSICPGSGERIEFRVPPGIFFHETRFYLFAEYVNMIMSSAIMASLFFGGFDIPFLDESTLAPNIAAILGVGALLTKIVIFIFIFMWIRWTIPRFRYDQLMDLGWKKLVPLALVNMLLTGAFILWRQGAA